MLGGIPWAGAHGLGRERQAGAESGRAQDYRKLGSLAAEVRSKGIARRLSWRIQAGDHARARAGGRLSNRLPARTQVFEGARSGDASPFRVYATPPKLPSGCGGETSPPLSIRRDRACRRDCRPQAICCSTLSARSTCAACRRAWPSRCGSRSRRSRRTAWQSARAACCACALMILLRRDLVLPNRSSAPALSSSDGDRSSISSPAPARPLAVSPFDLRQFDRHQHLIVAGLPRRAVHGRRGGSARATANAAIRMMARAAASRRRHGILSDLDRCAAPAVEDMLAAVRRARTSASCRRSARPCRPTREQLHQPGYSAPAGLRCLRVPNRERDDEEFSGAEILEENCRGGPDVGIGTVPPELDGASISFRPCVTRPSRLARALGASYEEASAGIEEGRAKPRIGSTGWTPIHHVRPGLRPLSSNTMTSSRTHLRRCPRPPVDGARCHRSQQPHGHHGNH